MWWRAGTIFVALIAGAAAYAVPAEAGGWTQKRGDFYVKAWARVISGKRAFLTDGTIAEIGGGTGFTDASLNYYLEYGFNDDLTFVAQGTPAGLADFDRASVYTGPLRLGFRHALLRAPFALAVEASVLGSLGFNEPDAQAIPRPATTAVRESLSYDPAPGNFAGLVELQAGLAHPWGWASASGGALLSTNEAVGDALFGTLQLGVSTSIGLVADFHMTARAAIGGLDPAEGTNISGAGRTTYIGIGLAATWWIVPRFGINAGADSAALARSNAATPSLTLGIEFR